MQPIAGELKKVIDVTDARFDRKTASEHFGRFGLCATERASASSIRRHPFLAARPRLKWAKPIAGYVYLIRSEYGHYKIGKTKSMKTRMSNFGLVLPFEIEIIHALRTSNMGRCEWHFHNHFAHQADQRRMVQLINRRCHVLL
jgi:hypothetical protein